MDSQYLNSYANAILRCLVVKEIDLVSAVALEVAEFKLK